MMTSSSRPRIRTCVPDISQVSSTFIGGTSLCTPGRLLQISLMSLEADGSALLICASPIGGCNALVLLAPVGHRRRRATRRVASLFCAPERGGDAPVVDASVRVRWRGGRRRRRRSRPACQWRLHQNLDVAVPVRFINHFHDGFRRLHALEIHLAHQRFVDVARARSIGALVERPWAIHTRREVPGVPAERRGRGLAEPFAGHQGAILFAMDFASRRPVFRAFAWICVWIIREVDGATDVEVEVIAGVVDRVHLVVRCSPQTRQIVHMAVGASDGAVRLCLLREVHH
mmetsp:Transcript_22745/g.59370  ORF Transcript_22745/g.59370 Transcript_22745/m.59370 type:complete len:287 (+) Transcript_22745:170-1030(+)